MGQETDILRAARYLIEVYGRNALRTAEKYADPVLATSPDATALAWRRIAGAVRSIQGSEPGGRHPGPG